MVGGLQPWAPLRTGPDSFFDAMATASTHKKLVMLYLCNDVVQNSKKKGDEVWICSERPIYRTNSDGRLALILTQFIVAFRTVLPSVLDHVSRHVSSDVLAKVLRLVNIWDERKIFSADAIAEFKRFLPAPGKKSAGAPSVGFPSSSGPASAVLPAGAVSLPTTSAPAGPAVPSNMATLARHMTKLEKLEQEVRTAPASGGGHFKTLEQQISAIPGMFFEEDTAREFRGGFRCYRAAKCCSLFRRFSGKEAANAAGELQTAIIALTNQRNMLQAAQEARLAVINELQRLVAVEEGLYKSHSLKVAEAGDKLARATRTHQALVRSADPSIVSAYSHIPKTPPGEPPGSAMGLSAATIAGLPGILAQLAGTPGLGTTGTLDLSSIVDLSSFGSGPTPVAASTSQQNEDDNFDSFIATPPSDRAPSPEPPTPPGANGSAGPHGQKYGVGASGGAFFGASGMEDDDMDDLGLGLGSGGIGAR